jgi:hypothetical protein
MTLEHGMERYERAFNAVGWLGFLLLTPVALRVFQVQPAVEFLDRLGVAGRPVFWTLIAFGLLVLRILFGGEATLLPLFLGLAVGFFLLALVARISFMRWFWGPASGLSFFESEPLSFVVGAAALFWGLVLSYLRRVSVLVQLLVLVVLPLVVLLAGNALKLL